MANLLKAIVRMETTFVNLMRALVNYEGSFSRLHKVSVVVAWIKDIVGDMMVSGLLLTRTFAMPICPVRFSKF